MTPRLLALFVVRPMWPLNFMVLAAVASPSLCAARAFDPPRAGDHVRLIIYDDRKVVGRLAAFDAVGLEVRDDRDSALHVLSRATVATLEVERPRTRVRLGAAIGFLSGGIAGMVVSRHDQNAGFFGGLGGALAGALLGTTARRERWEEAPLP